MCIHCSSLERHRLLWFFLKHKSGLFDDTYKIILHVAPESCLKAELEDHFKTNYITADLRDPAVKINMDITDIPYSDETFDVVLCNHVLEHVPNDRKALSELFRILKQGGWAILLVPICGDTTYEDPSLVTPRDRLEAFGLEDHVRRYGRDYVNRLQEAGFEVAVVKTANLIGRESATLMGLTEASGDIYQCFKPPRSCSGSQNDIVMNA